MLTLPPSVIELNICIICGCMPTLRPLLRKTIWSGESLKPHAYKPSYENTPRSDRKKTAASRSLDTGLTNASFMDASYIELGAPGTNRDVHIGTDEPQAHSTLVGQEEDGIMKTDTFGQAVTFRERIEQGEEREPNPSKM